MGTQRPWRWNLPLSTGSPYSMYDLAYELKMTVGELCYGRGTPMSNYELNVGWRCYFEERHRLARIEQARLEKQQRGHG